MYKIFCVWDEFFFLKTKFEVLYTITTMKSPKSTKKKKMYFYFVNRYTYFGNNVIVRCGIPKGYFVIVYSYKHSKNNDRQWLLFYFWKTCRKKYTSVIAVLFEYGLKNIAIDLCDANSMKAFNARIPCTDSMSSGESVTFNSCRTFLFNENEYNTSDVVFLSVNCRNFTRSKYIHCSVENYLIEILS